MYQQWQYENHKNYRDLSESESSSDEDKEELSNEVSRDEDTFLPVNGKAGLFYKVQLHVHNLYHHSES